MTSSGTPQVGSGTPELTKEQQEFRDGIGDIERRRKEKEETKKTGKEPWEEKEETKKTGKEPWEE